MRFFFDLVGAAGDRQHDHRGVELPNLAAAEIEAAEVLSQVRGGEVPPPWKAVAITSATGETLAVMQL